MSKGKGNIYDAKRAEVVKSIARKFSVTEGYVRQCIAGTANSGRSEEIRKAYNEKYELIKALLS